MKLNKQLALAYSLFLKVVVVVKHPDVANGL